MNKNHNKSEKETMGKIVRSEFLRSCVRKSLEELEILEKLKGLLECLKEMLETIFID